jgi:hypothetical protein
MNSTRHTGSFIPWPTTVGWDLSSGDTIRRTDLHARFGGRRQGGIGPSAKTPNVFLFTDPAIGQQHGYYDGRSDDGSFHYTGEGQRGDQTLAQGNLAIANHVADDRALRLFRGAGGEVLYLGEFLLPRRPRRDLESLASSAGVSIVRGRQQTTSSRTTTAVASRDE